VAEIGREAGIVDGNAGGIGVGTEAGVRLTGGWLEAGTRRRSAEGAGDDVGCPRRVASDVNSAV
jgi:hypothetical protein